MNSAVSEVNRLKEALKGITTSRDQLRQELQISVDKMETFSKKMAAQEDLVRKAAYTNVSYGKRLEDLTMGLKQKHNDVTAAKRKQLAAEEVADELRIQLGKVEKEFEMHREDSVDAQVRDWDGCRAFCRVLSCFGPF
jgi:chromosome segregation ATPase